MANSEKVLRIINHQYPFGQNPTFSPLTVLQTQVFASSQTLLQKKREMMRKRQMINNSAIITLLSIQVLDNGLVYEWEYVPHSFTSYLSCKFNPQNSAIWEMTRTLLIKKVTYELTVLMSYLAKMRIETELSMLTLGISHNEKVKLYLNPRSKMGIKSELFLISQYGQAKERVLRQLQGELDIIQNSSRNNVFKSTISYPEKKSKNQLYEPINLKNRIKSREKENKKQQPSRRKMSFGNFEFDSSHFDKQKMHSSRSTRREHKHSFQFNPQTDRFCGDEQPEEKEALLNHCKSIKIELQQKQVVNEQKKRKDSYKVKITTCRQYQVEDPSVFGHHPEREEDIFQYFAKKARQQEQEPQSPRVNKTSGINTAPSSPPLSPLLSPKSSQQQNLQQRIREARQRSQRVLNKIKSMKK